MQRPPRKAEPLLAEIENVYRTEYRKFLRLALALLGDRELAHEAVQETFARAIRSRMQLLTLASLEGWLWRTLVNHCRDLLRAKRPATASEEHAQLPRGDEPGVHGELRDAIARLPERQRLVIFLRHYADLTYEQIAEATGVERGTVAATLHTAHASLRRAMEGSAA
jgi:RNA polymerase sigma factor (sigma-70 family)